MWLGNDGLPDHQISIFKPGCDPLDNPISDYIPLDLPPTPIHEEVFCDLKDFYKYMPSSSTDFWESVINDDMPENLGVMPHELRNDFWAMDCEENSEQEDLYPIDYIQPCPAPIHATHQHLNSDSLKVDDLILVIGELDDSTEKEIWCAQIVELQPQSTSIKVRWCSLSSTSTSDDNRSTPRVTLPETIDDDQETDAVLIPYYSLVAGPLKLTARGYISVTNWRAAKNYLHIQQNSNQ